jgi:predicted nucleic acid-binding protein
MREKYFVFDTNTLISAFLLSNSTSREALNHATALGHLIASEATYTEFSEVLFRKKFDRYFPFAI